MLSSRRFQAGTVHYLDFDEFSPLPPEMVKGRAVIIVQPMQRRHTNLVIVVPVSSKPPQNFKKQSVRIMHKELNGEGNGSWAKCDMPMTVSTQRLQDYRRPKYEGQNLVPAIRISGDELRRVREALIKAIGGKEILNRMVQEQMDGKNQPIKGLTVVDAPKRTLADVERPKRNKPVTWSTVLNNLRKRKG